MVEKTIIIVFLSLYYMSVKSEEDCRCVPFYSCKNPEGDKELSTTAKPKKPVPKLDIRLLDSSPHDCPDYIDVCCEERYIMPPPNVTDEVPGGCGFRNPNGVGHEITGGVREAQFGEFPWMVAVLHKDNTQRSYKYRCGGSLIHPRAVLTAAHCVRKLGAYKVRVGEWDPKISKELYESKDVPVRQIIRHPHFNSYELYNDISILILDQEVPLKAHVNTICLPIMGFQASGGGCFVTGWGTDKFDRPGIYQAILKRVQLSILERGACQAAFGRTRLGKAFVLDSSFICAGGEVENDACTGDGGGPLVCPLPFQSNRYQQVGIVSWGIGCGQPGVPGAYTSLGKYRKWIDETLSFHHLNASFYSPEMLTY